jgi:drug/metabolite transporter (DMT)-like permease
MARSSLTKALALVSHRLADGPLPVAPRRRRAEPWALGSVAGYASANLFDRLAVTHSDPLVGPLLRGLPSLTLGIALVWKNRTLTQLLPTSEDYVGNRVLLSLLGAGAISTIGLFAYYFAIRMGGVTITIPVLQTYGLWGTLIAWFLLRERVGRMVVLGLSIIAAGLAALSLGQHQGQPISAHWYWAIPLALFAAVTYGLSGVLWRHSQLRGAHHSTAILAQFVASIIVALAGLALNGRLALIVTTPGRDLAALLASGILSGIVGIYCLFMALRLMTVARVFAYSALTPLIATLGAHFLLHEYLNPLMLVGVCLASIGVALTQIFRPKEELQAN